MGWVAHGSFLGKVAFDSSFQRRKSPGWAGWEEGIPRKGVAVGTPTPGVSLKESQHPGDRMAVWSPVLPGWQNRGKEGRGSPGSSREKKSSFHHQRLGSRFGFMKPTPSPRLTPHGIREAAGPPKSVRQGPQTGLPTQQPCDLGQATQLSMPVSYQTGKMTVTT